MWKKRIEENFGRADGIYTGVDQNSRHVVRDRITLTIDYLSRAVSTSEEAVLGTSHLVDLVDLFTGSPIQSFMELVHAIAEEGEASVPSSEVWLTFLK